MFVVYYDWHWNCLWPICIRAEKSFVPKAQSLPKNISEILCIILECELITHND